MMKSSIITFVVLFSCICGHAQKLNVDKFDVKSNDITARTHPRQDINGNDCALVKVQLAAPNAIFDGNVIGDVAYNTSEYLVYMSQGSKRMTIKLESYLPLEVNFEDYNIKSLESKTVYVMTISGISASNPIEPVRIKTGWIILNSDPSGASVYINDEFIGNTPITNYKQTYGIYNYRIEHPNYHPETGTIELNSGKTEKSLSLKPAFGSIAITSSVTGAKVLLDGKATNKVTPCTLEEVPSGQHTIIVQKDKYSPRQQNVIVEDGQTAKVSITLDARFAQVSISSLDGAQIYCNGEYKGTTRYIGDLMEGYYDVEVRLAHHKSISKQIQVIAGQSQDISLNPTPIYGSLDVTSTPYDADVTIDGKLYGKTPLTVEQLLEGEHTIKIKKDGYSEESLLVTIYENDNSASYIQLQRHSDICQVSTNSGGELSVKLYKPETVKKLKIAGYMDARDFKFIKDNCKQLQYLDLSDVKIVAYRGNYGTDKNTQNYPANEIPLGAFFYWVPIDDGMPSLIEIILPVGIKKINRNAFARAYNLKKINIPEGVTNIGYVAFAICTSLQTIELPSTLMEIGPLAFANCKELSFVTVKCITPPSINDNSFEVSPNAILYVPTTSISAYKNSKWSKFFKIQGIK